MNEDMVPQKVLDETRALLLYYQDSFYKVQKAYAEQIEKHRNVSIEFTKDELNVLMDEIDFNYSLTDVTYPQAIVSAVNDVLKGQDK